MCLPPRYYTVLRVASLAVLSLLFSLLACAFTPAPKASPSQVRSEFTYANPEQFNRCTHDASIDIASTDGTVQLAPREYIVHDDGFRIDYATTKYLRKAIFQLDRVESAGAKLYTYGMPKDATFNGTPLTFHSQKRGIWMEADIPVNALQPGENVLLLPIGSNVPLDIDQKSQNSVYSEDAGKTWKPLAGEIMAHLALVRHPAQGVITSDVIDLASPRNDTPICPLVVIQSIKFAMSNDCPRDTRIKLEARSGNNLQPDASWQPWRSASRVKSARYLQWRAILTTKDHLVTPALKAVRITANLTVKSDPITANLSVVTDNNPLIVRSSYPYTYQAPSEKLAKLRAQYKLDAIIAPGKTEMEQYILLRNWVRKQWPHNEGPCARPWDALDILSAPAGDHGMCVHFGVTFTQCALALGFNARQIILRNHYVSEIWSNALRKWVLMDVESVQPEGWDRYGTSIYLDAARRPLNALEIHRHLTRDAAREMTQVLSMTDAQGIFAENERHYGPEEYGNFQHFGIPHRNDYLDHLTPWEVSHGVSDYHCNDYLWWADSGVPITPEYSRYTSREGDFYWTLNQSAVTLTMTRTADQLAVAVDTVTPNFKQFRYRLNDNPWQVIAGTGDSESRQAYFTWPLVTGRNTLEVVTQNQFGRDGIPTTITIEKR